MHKDEKRAFDALNEELRSMNAPEPEDDLADIYALLDKDYTKPSQEPQKAAPEPAAAKSRKPGKKAATGHASRETRELSRELLEEPAAPAPGKKRSLIPMVLLAVAELALIAAVIVWWFQWLS